MEIYDVKVRATDGELIDGTFVRGNESLKVSELFDKCAQGVNKKDLEVTIRYTPEGFTVFDDDGFVEKLYDDAYINEFADLVDHAYAKTDPVYRIAMHLVAICRDDISVMSFSLIKAISNDIEAIMRQMKDSAPNN